MSSSILRESLLRSERVFEGRLLSVRKDTVQSRRIGTITREVVEHPGAVGIVPLSDQSEIIMVEQYRHAVGKYLLEIPAGTLEREETPINCARRELLEETGFQASRFRRLLRCYLAPGYSSELITIYEATGLKSRSRAPAPDENLKVRRLELKNVLEMIHRNHIKDAKTICGIFALIGSRHEA